MTADAMVRSKKLNGPQALRWDAQDMASTNPEVDILESNPTALAVFGHWMETGESASYRDIAKRMGSRSGTVRRALAAVDGFVVGCDVVGSKWVGSPQRRIDAYAPSHQTLRAVMLAQRTRIGAMDREARPERYLEGRDAGETECR